MALLDVKKLTKIKCYEIVKIMPEFARKYENHIKKGLVKVFHDDITGEYLVYHNGELYSVADYELLK